MATVRPRSCGGDRGARVTRHRPAAGGARSRLAFLRPSLVIFVAFFFYPLSSSSCSEGLYREQRGRHEPPLRRLVPVRGRPHRPRVPRGPAGTAFQFVHLHRADRAPPRHGAGGGRQPPPARHQGVPGDLLVHHRHLGRRGVGGVPRADQPADRRVPGRGAWLRDQAILENPRTAMFGVSLSSIWQNLGLSFMIVLAGLQAIPRRSTRRPPSTATGRCAASCASPCR